MGEYIVLANEISGFLYQLNIEKPKLNSERHPRQYYGEKYAKHKGEDLKPSLERRYLFT